MVALPILVVLLAGMSGLPATAEDVSGPAGLVTEEIEPGVERIVRDDAGHDLDERHPTYRYDMDAIAIGPDGSIWLSTTYSRSDNEAHPEVAGPLVWALGRPGTYEVGNALYGTPPASPTPYLFMQPDGTSTLAMVVVVSSEDIGSIPDFEAEGVHPENMGGHSVLVARPDGEHRCWNMGLGVMCQRPAGGLTNYLPVTVINQIAAAPDGTLWAVGGFDGDNGGLYRITLQ